MIKQTVIASAAIAAAAMFATAPANAGVTIGFGVGHGFGGYYYDPHPYHAAPGYFPSVDKYSCREGRRMVRRNGFRRVRAIECNGRYYTYRARSGGERLRVRLDSYSGDIINVRAY